MTPEQTAFVASLVSGFSRGLTSVDAQRAMALGLNDVGQKILTYVAGLLPAQDLYQQLFTMYDAANQVPALAPAPAPSPTGSVPGVEVPGLAPTPAPPPVGGAPGVPVPAPIPTPSPAPTEGTIPGVGVPAEGMLVGGGQEQARLALEAADLAQRGELARMSMGQQLLAHLSDIQRDPFSIVTALKGYGAAGGGTLAPSADLYASGGAGRPSQYGGLYDAILQRLGGVAAAGGAGVPPVPSGSLSVTPGAGVGMPLLQTPTAPARTNPLVKTQPSATYSYTGYPTMLGGLATMAGVR